MTGFEAISHHNGWVMAVSGALIVFSGLAVLSFLVSLLPKLFHLFEKKRAGAPSVSVTGGGSPSSEMTMEAAAPLERTDPARIAKQIEPLVSTLAEPFQLSDLYRLCRENDIPHPHLSLSWLQREGFLHPQGEGAFTWKPGGATAEEG